MVETTPTFGSEISTVEMDYLRRGAMISRRERMSNEEVRNVMSAETQTLLDRTDARRSWNDGIYYYRLIRIKNHT